MISNKPFKLKMLGRLYAREVVLTYIFSITLALIFYPKHFSFPEALMIALASIYICAQALLLNLVFFIPGKIPFYVPALALTCIYAIMYSIDPGNYDGTLHITTWIAANLVACWWVWKKS